MLRKIGKAWDHASLVARSALLRAWPPLYARLEIRPTSCNIMLTNRCNLRCVMCRQWRGRPETELTTDEWQKVIADLAVSGIRSIHFTGGEPLLRNDLGRLVAFAVQRGMTPGMTTNGILLTPESARALVDAGIRSIAISMDALDEQYEKVRGVAGTFGRLRAALETVAKLRRERGIDAYINFTLMSDTIEGFPAVKAFADTVGLPVGICLLDKASTIFDVEENAGKFWIGDASGEAVRRFIRFVRSEFVRDPGSLLINNPGIDYIPAYFADPRQARIPCAISQDRIFVDPYGMLFGGCLAMGTFGCLRDYSFRQLSGAERYRKAKESMYYKRCPGCSCGYMFNIRHLPGLVLRDLGMRVRQRILERR